jgi:hypothetical protein
MYDYKYTYAFQILYTEFMLPPYRPNFAELPAQEGFDAPALNMG